MNDAITALLAEYDKWSDDRDDLSTADDRGVKVSAKAREKNDDQAVDLLDRIVAAVRGGPSDYTVTIAGPERHDGEAPYMYVVTARSHEQALRRARAAFCQDQEQATVDIGSMTVEPGLPTVGHWNDRREATR